MRFATIEPAFRRAVIRDYLDIEAAERAIGLQATRVDFAIALRNDERRIGIVVYEFGFFIRPNLQSYFAIGNRAYAGNAVLYEFDDHGATINMPEPLPPIVFFDDAMHLEHAISGGEIVRPAWARNGKVLWAWPSPPPADMAARM